MRRLLHEEADVAKGVPENSAVVIPRLICRDPAAAVDFCVNTFNAVVVVQRPGPDGKTIHALLTIGPAMIMIESEWPEYPGRAPNADGSSPVVIFVYIEDVDAAVDRAVAHGARVLVPAQDQFWGDRTAWVIDPSGHVWTIATRVETTTAEQRSERWSNTLEGDRRAE